MTGNGNTNENLKAHTESYSRFIWWLKAGSIATAAVVIFVIALITR